MSQLLNLYPSVLLGNRVALLGLAFGCGLLLTTCTTHPPPNDEWQDGRCQLTIATSPEIRGVRLGMTAQQVQGIFPRLLILDSGDNGAPGLATGDVYKNEVDSAVDLRGVDSIHLAFLDNRLIEIQVYYEETQAIRSQEELESRISDDLHLPPFLGGKIECYDFRISTLTVPSPAGNLELAIVTFTDVAARKILTGRSDVNDEILRREKLEQDEQRKKTFKP